MFNDHIERFLSLLHDFPPCGDSAVFQINASSGTPYSLLVTTTVINGCCDEVAQSLKQHAKLDKKYIMPLLHYELDEQCDTAPRTDRKITSKGTATVHLNQTVRAIYLLTPTTLSDLLDERIRNNQPFDEFELEEIGRSIARSLAYLKEQNIAYGVLQLTRAYLDQGKIKIIDPIATGCDPLDPAQSRLTAPQIRSIDPEEGRSQNDRNSQTNYQTHCNQIDLFQADVYCLGYILLQLSTLSKTLNLTFRSCVPQLKRIYSAGFLQTLGRMLREDPAQRPCLEEVVELFTEPSLTEREDEQETIESILIFPLPESQEDQPNIASILTFTEDQNFDLNRTDGDEEETTAPIASQYQKTLRRFLEPSSVGIIADTTSFPRTSRCSKPLKGHTRSISYTPESFGKQNLPLNSNCSFIHKSSANKDSQPKLRSRAIREKIVKYPLEDSTVVYSSSSSSTAGLLTRVPSVLTSHNRSPIPFLGASFSQNPLSTSFCLAPVPESNLSQTILLSINPSENYGQSSSPQASLPPCKPLYVNGSLFTDPRWMQDMTKNIRNLRI